MWSVDRASDRLYTSSATLRRAKHDLQVLYAVWIGALIARSPAEGLLDDGGLAFLYLQDTTLDGIRDLIGCMSANCRYREAQTYYEVLHEDRLLLPETVDPVDCWSRLSAKVPP